MYSADLNVNFIPYNDQEWIDNLSTPPAGKNYMLADFPKDYKTNKELLSWLDAVGVDIPFWDIFVSTPNFTMHIHNDNNDCVDNMTKLNWVYEDGYSQMVWYKLKENAQHKIYENDGMDDYALSWDHSEVEQVYSAVIGKPSLVNAGQPHNIINVSSKKRVCLSFFLIDKETDKPLQWERAMELFKEYICQDTISI